LSIILLGSKTAAFTAGIAEHWATGDILPFFGVGPTGPIEAALAGGLPVGEVIDDLESVKLAVQVFSEHGTVVFMDNLEASSNMLNTIVRVIRVATESDWVLREQETITVN
jgi:hypothetical protein